MEIWEAIPGFEGYYDVSSFGRVRSLDRIINQLGKRQCVKSIKGRLLRPAVSHGYHSYVLWKDHKQTTIRAHHAVAYAFLGPRPDGTYVCHRDGDRLNNALSNIYYGTPSENVADARTHGTLAVGEKAGSAKLTAIEIARIKKMAETHLQREICAEFGISQAQVSRIVNGKEWKHIDEQAPLPEIGGMA